MTNWLWLDDVRPAPGEGWAHVWNYDEAISWFQTHGTPELASLDHDLADAHYARYAAEVNGDHAAVLRFMEQEDEKTGFDLVLYMMAHAIFPERVIVHSMNQIGAGNMIKELQRYGYVWRGMARVPNANPHSWIMER